MSPARSHFATISAIVLLPLLLAGCSANDGPAPSPSASAKAEQSARSVEVQKCMRDAGYEVDGDQLADPSADLTVPKGVDQATFYSALALCAKGDAATDGAGGDTPAADGDSTDAPAADGAEG